MYRYWHFQTIPRSACCFTVKLVFTCRCHVTATAMSEINTIMLVIINSYSFHLKWGRWSDIFIVIDLWLVRGCSQLGLGMAFLGVRGNQLQWRIQDFPDGGRGEGTSILEFGAQTLYLARFLPKIAWKWKKLDRDEGHPSLALAPWISQWTIRDFLPCGILHICT